MTAAVMRVESESPASGGRQQMWAKSAQKTNITNQCHDIRVLLEIGLAAAPVPVTAFLLDISDLVHAVQLDQAVDKNFVYWHSTTFNNDGWKVIFANEWRGGMRPRCRATDPSTWGADAIFDIVDRKLRVECHGSSLTRIKRFRNVVLSTGTNLRYVLNVFIRVLFGELRRLAHKLLGLRSSQCGAVTFVQRYGDALNANPHFHCLCIDGVYAAGSDGRPEFHQLPAPEDEDVLRLTTTILCQRSILLEASRPWTRSGSATGRSFVAESRCDGGRQWTAATVIQTVSDLEWAIRRRQCNST